MAKQGSAINFVIVGSRQKFELNKSNVEKHNLKVASTLENLAVLVNYLHEEVNIHIVASLDKCRFVCTEQAFKCGS